MNPLEKINRLHTYLKDKLERSKLSDNEIARLHNETTLQFFEVMFADELKEVERLKILN